MKLSDELSAVEYDQVTRAMEGYRFSPTEISEVCRRAAITISAARALIEELTTELRDALSELDKEEYWDVDKERLLTRAVDWLERNQ